VTDPSIQPTPRSTPADPWGHEVGEDLDHQLDAAGHVRHQSEPVARLLGEPKPVGPSLSQRSVDPKVAVGVLLAVVAAIAVVLVVLLS
jgi:hypothetical protein